MLDPDTIYFSYSVMSYDEYSSSERVHLTQTLEPLANVVIHLASAIFRLLIAPFQQTLQFTAYELFSSYRNLQLVFGIILAAFDKPYGHYLMYVAKENIDNYDYFLGDFYQHRETLEILNRK